MAALLLAPASDDTAEGMNALEEGRYEQAAVSFRKVLAASPDEYGAIFHLALIDSLQGNNTEAIAGYQKVLGLKPGLYEAELNLGMLLLDSGQAARAVVPLTGAVEKKPGEYRPNFYLAESLFETGDYSRAEGYYRKAVELNVEDAPSELGLARSIARRGRLDEAAIHYHRAAELDSSYRDALRELASAYEENDRLPEAIALYRQFPDDAAVQERTGQLLLELGRNSEAMVSLEMAVQASPTAANRYALAVAFIRQEQFGRAEPLLELALDEEPENFELRMTYGRLLRDQRKYDQAAREFLRATEREPTSREAWSELASMLMLLEDYPRAIAALDRTEQLGEDSPGVYYFRALAHDRSRQYEPALENYERFLQLSDDVLPDQEFLARQRIRVILRELGRR